MKKLKKNSGITLIALVITIIVLLLLAGISIQALTGNGIFGKAKEAIEKHKYEAALEKVKLAVNGAFDEKGEIDDNYLYENLDSIQGKESLAENEEKTEYIIKVDGYYFTVSKESGKITKKDIEIADGEIDSSRDDLETIGNMQNQINYMSNVISNLTTDLTARLDATYTKDQVNTLIQDNVSDGTLGQSWTEILNKDITKFTVQSGSNKWTTGDNVNINQYRFIGIGSIWNEKLVLNVVIMPVDEFKKFNSNDKYVSSAVDVTYQAIAYIDSGNKIYLGTTKSNTHSGFGIVIYGIN